MHTNNPKPDPQSRESGCGAHNRDGSLCDMPAGWGTTHPGIGRCRKHGGASPRAEVAGQVHLARREAMIMGVPLDIDPHHAILECIRITAGEVAYASERIAELDADEIIDHVRTETWRPMKTAGGGENVETRVVETKVESPALHIWIQVRHKAMDRLVNYSAAALKAGIEDRIVKVAEQQGQMLAHAIQGVLRELGIADRPDVPAVVRKHLTMVAGAGVDGA